jgi:hypothetical protein
VLFILTLLSACATADSRLQQAGQKTGLLAASAFLPDYPVDCRKRETSGVRAGEPLDLALIRTDQALGRANARVTRCSRWYDTIKSEFSREQRD